MRNENNVKLTERTNAPLSSIREISSQIPVINKEREFFGLDPLINLSIGQPHIPPDPKVLDAVQAKLNSGTLSFCYSRSQGRTETLEAIVRLYSYYYPEVDYTKDEVMVTNGASGALWNAFSILIEKNDIVLAFEPYFSTYSSQIQALYGELKKIPTFHNNFRPDIAKLEESLATYPNAKVLILNYPNNPSGVSLHEDDLQALARKLNEYPQLIVIIDDVYRDLNYTKHLTLLDIDPSFRNRCVVINSGAKGLAGAPDLKNRYGECQERVDTGNVTTTIIKLIWCSLFDAGRTDCCRRGYVKGSILLVDLF